MQRLIEQLIESAKTNKKALLALKNAAVIAQQFELAANIREIEKTNFPLSVEQKAAKERVSKLKIALAMTDIKTDDGTLWMVDQVIKKFNKKKGKFDLSDAAAIGSERDKLFDREDK